MGERRSGRFDKNRDRCVNGSELYQICRAVECAVTAMEIQEMLRMFDNDGDGTVRRQRQLSRGERAWHLSACGVWFCAARLLSRGGRRSPRQEYSLLILGCVREYPLVRLTTRSSSRASHAWR